MRSLGNKWGGGPLSQVAVHAPDVDDAPADLLARAEVVRLVYSGDHD